MNPLLTFRIAWRALAKNKMRAGLTVLGVVIGIAAVTAMVSLGQSAGALVRSQFASLGTNVLMIFPESHRRGGVAVNSISSVQKTRMRLRMSARRLSPRHHSSEPWAK